MARPSTFFSVDKDESVQMASGRLCLELSYLPKQVVSSMPGLALSLRLWYFNELSVFLGEASFHCRPEIL